MTVERREALRRPSSLRVNKLNDETMLRPAQIVYQLVFDGTEEPPGAIRTTGDEPLSIVKGKRTEKIVRQLHRENPFEVEEPGSVDVITRLRN